MKKEKKKFSGNLNPFLVLMVMVVICTIVSYFVVPGAYDRETVDGVTRVVADSYHAVERTPVGLFDIHTRGYATRLDSTVITRHKVEPYGRKVIPAIAQQRIVSLREYQPLRKE